MSTHTFNNLWMRLYFNDKLTNKLGFEIAVNHRRQAFSDKYNLLEKQQLQSYWLWINFNVTKNINLYVLPISHFEIRRVFEINERAINEWRWGLKLEHRTILKYFQLLNSASLEYRWRDLETANQFSGNFRARYLFKPIIPLANIKERPLNLVLNDEIFFQFGDAAKQFPSYFDQNRCYAGFNYNIFKNIKLELGYCYVYQYRPTGNDIDIQNAFWLFLTFENVFSQFKQSKVNQ